jgi:eukaryotic-like serine/threonine-protein kinase
VLLDFGVAKLLDAPGPALTSSRNIVGTLACISPEQLLGESVDPRTDVYALGVLTYRMLVGEPPFAERSYPMLRQLHLFVSPPRPSTRARVSPAFDDVLLRAMSKDRNERHPTIAAFLDEFRATVGTVRGAGAPPSGARVRRALAIYAEVHAEPSALAEPEDRLLADLEAILPFLAAELTSAGLTAAAETGGSVLFTAERPDEPAVDQETRRRVMDTVLGIYRQVEMRAGRDDRVHVRLCLHAGEVVDTGKGAPVGGELLELAAWVPDEVDDGVFASAEVVADLEISSTPGDGALLRIAIAAGDRAGSGGEGPAA